MSWLTRLRQRCFGKLGFFTHARAPKAKRRWTFQPALEPFEDRLTPAATFAITGVTFVNAVGPVTPTIGQSFSVTVDYTVQNLKSNGSYTMGFYIDGTGFSFSDFEGAGQSGVNSSTLNSDMTWQPTPGMNSVDIIVGSQKYTTPFVPQESSTPGGGYTVDRILLIPYADRISNFGTMPADGAGQTFAIVDAYNDPKIIGDLEVAQAAQRHPASPEFGDSLAARYPMKAKKRQEDFRKAYNYLRKRTKFMRYAAYKRVGIPSGSGVTEAACKTIYTQRLKLSGMRWKMLGAQTILNLRVMLLSGVWTEAYQRILEKVKSVEVPSYALPSRKKLKIAA